MLGTDLVPVLRAAGSVPVVHDLPDCNIRRRDDVARALDGVGVLVNCAAYTNVEAAESEREVAMAVNGAALATIGQLAAERDVYVLHISTDFVFDGRASRPYTEDDTPNPLSVYGTSKLAGETALAASACRHAIIRVQWTYGNGGRSFVDKVVAAAQARGALRMVADQVGSPTWTRDVSDVLASFVREQHQGLYHYAAAGHASRFEVAKRILQEKGIRADLSACRTADFPSAAQRPLNSCFDCTRIDRLLEARRPRWEDSLRAFLGETVST